MPRTPRQDPWGKAPVLPSASRQTRRTDQEANEKREREYQLANRMRETYTVERRLYETRQSGIESRYRPSRRHEGLAETLEEGATKNVWVHAVRSLTAEGIDPVHYVTRIFSFLHGSAYTPPNPGQLLSSLARDMYLRSKGENEDSIVRALTIQGEIAKREIALHQIHGKTMLEATRYVLLDATVSLSALFRYCLARSMRKKSFTRLANDHYLDEAALQYIRDKELYDDWWRDYLPKGFSKEARRIYAKLYRDV